MKALAITHTGIEDITASEISELIKAKTEIKESCVIFEPKKIEDLALLCYKSHSIKKILYLFDYFKLNSIKDIKISVQKNIQKIKKFIKSNKTFAVRCLKLENEDMIAEELCIETADALELSSKVDLNNPDYTFFIYLYKDECYLGIDFSGVDLDKRDYRIYVHQETLKANLAYSLLRISDYKKNETILDPFCGSGTILIEAALFSTNLSQNYYSKEKFAFLKFMDFDFKKLDKIIKIKSKLFGFDKELRHVVAAKKNAKIAGINDSVDFSRIEIEWLDTKVKEKTIDKIITNPPNLTKRISEKDIEKLYKQLFYQADFLLKKDGTVALITRTQDLIKSSAEKYKFRIIHEREFNIGNDIFKIFVFKK